MAGAELDVLQAVCVHIIRQEVRQLLLAIHIACDARPVNTCWAAVTSPQALQGL